MTECVNKCKRTQCNYFEYNLKDICRLNSDEQYEYCPVIQHWSITK